MRYCEDTDINLKGQKEEYSIKMYIAISPAKRSHQLKKLSTVKSIPEMAESLRALIAENASLWVKAINSKVDFHLEFRENNPEPMATFFHLSSSNKNIQISYTSNSLHRKWWIGSSSKNPERRSQQKSCYLLSTSKSYPDRNPNIGNNRERDDRIRPNRKFERWRKSSDVWT